MFSRRVGETRCVRVAVILVVLMLAGCGVPQQLSKQAEEVHSVAAEGALLAHEASEGSLDTFTSEHAKALQKRLAKLQPAIQNPDLVQLAAKVSELLRALAERPGDRGFAALIEEAFTSQAKAADELTG
jgi:outer membrane murein-binding lipoprotein Lpp